MATGSDIVWEVPQPLSVCTVRIDDETAIVMRRHGNPSGPRMILSHGNGLAIDLYYPFWSLLADDFDLVVYDLRNHGWNSVGTLREHNFPSLVSDHDAVAHAAETHYGKKPTIGIFHSVSGLASLLSPARGSGYAAMVLFDPPLCKPDDSYEQFDAAAMRAAAMARSRSPRFESIDQFAELLRILPVFQNAVPGVHELLARTTLREDKEGRGYTLRCPREYEAQIVDYARAFAVLVDFGALRCPIKVIGADPTLPFSYLPSLDLSDIDEVEYDFLPETTHFLPLEKPDECAAEVRDFLDSISFA